MKKNPPKKFPQYRKRTQSDVGAGVIERLKKARLSTRVSLQTAGSALGISMSTMWAMEHLECPMTSEQAEALAKFYGQCTCAIAEDVAAVLQP